MGVKCDYADFQKQLDEIQQKAFKAIEDAFAEAGETAVERARETKTYRDITGNLTESIGYGVVRNGELLRYGGFGGGEGGKKGLSCLRGVVGSINAPLALVVVAGMEYAIYVERKGYVVLDGGTIGIEEEIRSRLEKIKL